MRARSFVVCVLTGSIGSVALGQLVPPAPAKTPPTPEYTPPPPPAPPPQIKPPANPAGTPEVKPAEPAAPLPSLIERDEKGKIKPLGKPTEEAAIRALKPSDETMQKVEVSLAARRGDLDRLVAENVETVVEVMNFAAKVDDKTLVNDLATAGRKTVPFKNFVSVAEKLSRDGAIDPQTKMRAMQVAKEYETTLDKESYGNLEHSNIQEMALLGFKRHIRVTMSEAFASLDRQLAAAAPKMEEVLGKVELSDGAKTKVAARQRGLPKAGKPEADAKRLEALKAIFFEDLSGDERVLFLRAANPKLAEPKPAPSKDAPAAPAPATGTPAPAKK